MPDNNNNNQETSQGEQTQDFETMYKQSSAEWHKRFEQAKKFWIKAVKSDPKTLLEIHQEDPKLAESIAKSEYDLSFEEAKAQIEWFSPSNNWTNEDELADKIYSKIQQKTEKQKTSEVVDKFYSKNNIEWDFKKDFEWIYNDLIEWKKLTSDSAKKYLDIAFREAKQTSKNLEEHEKAVNNAKVLWGAGKWDGWKTKRVEWRQILGKWNSKPDSWY